MLVAPGLARATITAARPVLGVVALVVLATGAARGQAQVRFPTQPLLTLDTGGHHAPVRALLFAEQGGVTRLLTGGYDKVVHEWEVEPGNLRLTRTIRPPVWRGPRGMVFALALSAPQGGVGRRLAVAGYGREASGGSIGIYRYPGAGIATGDLEVRLAGGGGNQAEPSGHTNVVTAMAFDPTGRFLVSGSADRTARLWDVDARRSVVIFRGHEATVSALAYVPGGRRLVTADRVGVICLWDVPDGPFAGPAPQVIAPFARIEPDREKDRVDIPGSAAINALGVSPDGAWLVVGRENGRLLRFDLSQPGTPPTQLATGAEQGAVEGLALSHDGSMLATSIVARRIDAPGDRPTVRCVVEVRDFPDGRERTLLHDADNLVYTLAFGPGDRLLALAGGDAQGVVLVNPRDAAAPRIEARGQGRSIWGVAFDRDSRIVGFARSHPPEPDQPDGRAFEGFDLSSRRFVAFEPAPVPPRPPDAWEVRRVGPLELEVVAGGVVMPLKLDRGQDGRWWSHAVIPPGPGHARQLVAVGCDEGGVALFGLDAEGRQLRRMRQFNGHTGPVYALASSPDGRWMASGSSDQTIRLWRLAGSGEPPDLGALIEPRDGRQVVARVDPLSFAQGAGLREGDIVERVSAGDRSIPFGELPARLAAEPPGVVLTFDVLRGGDRLSVATTRRDSPALSLFPGLDHEWVIWMPEGYYDTSPAGDQRHLGWHRNPVVPERPDAGPEGPTEFVPIGLFERELRQPRVLETLVQTADLSAALAAAPDPGRSASALAEQEGPPTVRILTPDAVAAGGPIALPEPRVTIRVRAASEGYRPIRSLEFQIDGDRRHAPVPIRYDPPRASVEETLVLDVPRGAHRINVVATNDRDRPGAAAFEVVSPAPPRAPRLLVMTFGAERFANHAGAAIRFAEADARDVAEFLAAPGGRRRYPEVEAGLVLVGDRARSAGLVESLDGLTARLDGEDLGSGDTLIVLLETHFVSSPEGRFLAAADFGPGGVPDGAIPAADVADALGRVADYGCRVVLLLDLVHETTPEPWRGGVGEWVRDLYLHRNVITFVATDGAPGERLGGERRRRHGAFTQGVLDCLKPAGQARLWDERDLLTLGGFKESVTQTVHDLTSGRQFPACYIPTAISPRAGLLDPLTSEVGTDAISPSR